MHTSLLSPLPPPRAWSVFAWLLSGLLFWTTWLIPASHAAEDLNWSSGLYRAEPGHNPFTVPSAPNTNRYPESQQDPWWDQERYPGTNQERFVPRFWEPDNEAQPSLKRTRPWGDIPSYLDEYDTRRPDRSPYYNDRPTWDEEQRTQPRRPPRYAPDQERRPARSAPSYWDGPYQREYSRERERYDRYDDFPDPGYSEHYPNYDVDPWWRSRRYRQDSWDPWDRDRVPPTWER